jgi:transcriptional regulator of arginine metabolism
MMSKQTRHFAIKELVSTRELVNQNQLQRELKKVGFSVTQATLSRDLQELGVGRAPSAGKRVYVLQPAAELQGLRPLVGAEVVSISANETLVVIHTLPGCANTVGEFIDVLKNGDIIGTVAGDNTLLVIPQSNRKTAQLVQFLKQKLIEGR